MSVPLPADRDRDGWQLAVWNADDAILSRGQKLNLMLALEAGFNNFDPFRVVADLLAHRGLWEAAVMREGFPWENSTLGRMWHLHSNLLPLRDLAEGRWSVDTFYLLHDPAHTPALERLVAGWRADEVGAITGDPAGQLLGVGGSCGRSILRVWWD